MTLKFKDQRFPDKSWTVEKVDDQWYWFNDQGFPIGPYDKEDLALEGLDDYDNSYYD